MYTDKERLILINFYIKIVYVALQEHVQNVLPQCQPPTMIRLPLLCSITSRGLAAAGPWGKGMRLCPNSEPNQEFKLGE